MISGPDLEQLLKNAEIDIDDKTKSESLKDLTERIDHLTIPPRGKLHLTRFAAAAMVLILALIYFYQLDKLPDFSSAAFAHIIEATSQANCVHVTISKAGSDFQKQIWRDFKRGIMCETQPNGMIRYVDANSGDQYVYHSSIGKLVHRRSADSFEFMEQMPRPDRMLAELMDEIEGSHAEITVKDDVFNGDDVQVYNVRLRQRASDESVEYEGKFEFVVQSGSNLLLSISVAQYRYDIDHSGQMRLVFSYPDNIAEDIYAFGVPENVEIVNVVKNDRVANVLEAYKRASDNVPAEYPVEQELRIILPDGRVRTSVNKYEKSDEVTRNLHRLGWPQELCSDNPFVSDISIVEDDYSRDKSLVCVQIITQGHRRRSFVSRLPSKKLLYLNPRRDYICEKSVVWALREPTWPEGAPWLEDNCEDECHLEYEVTKYAQTINGKWYPAEKIGQTTVWLSDGQEEIYKHHFNIELSAPQ